MDVYRLDRVQDVLDLGIGLIACQDRGQVTRRDADDVQAQCRYRRRLHSSVAGNNRLLFVSGKASG